MTQLCQLWSLGVSCGPCPQLCGSRCEPHPLLHKSPPSSLVAPQPFCGEQPSAFPMARPADFGDRVAAIMTNGLPCRIACNSDGGFTRLDLEPMQGWVHLADDATVAEYATNGWHYHISLSTWSVDDDVWRRVYQRWHGAYITIKAHYVNDNGGVVLAWAGVGADPDIWQLYTTGSFGYKWEENRYGLHISM